MGMNSALIEISILVYLSPGWDWQTLWYTDLDWPSYVNICDSVLYRWHIQVQSLCQYFIKDKLLYKCLGLYNMWLILVNTSVGKALNVPVIKPGPRMVRCRSPHVQILGTETQSWKEGALLGKSMLSAEYVGNNPASQNFSFLSGPSL